MSAITTHVLDTAAGRPAAGVPITIESRSDDGDWHVLGRGATDTDGRLRDLLPGGFILKEGEYRLTFDTATYFASIGAEAFYAEVSVSFVVCDAGAHYHVPLLLSPYSYTTYRGS